VASIPRVLLLDDGELDDVQRILEDLEVDFGRVQGGASAPNTPLPKALLMATPRRIASVMAIDNLLDDEEPPVRVVVVDQDSKTLRDQLRQVGFDFLVRRPVHPEALRLLVMHSLYRGEEKRRDPRVAVGLEISFQTGEIPRRATLVDLSTGGCRLISTFELEAGKQILVTLPESLGATEPITLEGRILRSSYDKRIGEEGMHSAAVKFEDLSADLRHELEWIIEDKVGGPPALKTAPELAKDGAETTEPPQGDKPTYTLKRAKQRRPLRRSLLEKESPILRSDPRSEGAPRTATPGAAPNEAVEQQRFPLSVPVDVKMARPTSIAKEPVTQSAPKPPVAESASKPSVAQAAPKPPVAESATKPPAAEVKPPVAESASKPPVAKVAPKPPVAESATKPPAAEVESKSGSAPAISSDDRRAAPRYPYSAKVPAFGTRALRVLVGRDISVGGMRIESNPDLEVGDRLHLAIYGDASEEPFLVWGTILRGDGRGGTAVAFDPVHPSIAKQLEALVASLPAVESLHDDEAAAMGTVLTEIINE
jgi:hypothetical protein